LRAFCGYELKERMIFMELKDLNLSEEQLKGVQAILQSEGDKIRTSYSQKIKDLEGKLPKTLTDEEKTLAEKSKVLEDKEKELNKRERLVKVESTLESKGLNKELSKYLNLDTDDLETYLEEVVKTMESQVNFKPTGHKSGGTKVTKEDFKNMGYTDRVNLYNTNKPLYDALSKE